MRIVPKFLLLIVIISLAWSPGYPPTTSPAQAKTGWSPAQLDETLRTGDLDRSKQQVLDNMGGADQLFLSYLRQDLNPGQLRQGDPPLLERARRLADVFFKLSDFDFELGVIAYWEKADAEKKRALLPVLTDHFALYKDERTLEDNALPPFGSSEHFVDKYLALAERYRAIAFGKGQLQARLRMAAFNPGKAWQAWQLAKSLQDEVGQAWAAYYYSVWAGEGPSETAARQAVESGERLGLPRLLKDALTRQAWRANSRNDFDAHLEFFRKGLEVMRSIPLRQAMVGRWFRSYYPGEAWFCLALWRALELKGKTGAQEMFEKGRALSRQVAGKVGELAYLIEATPQFYRPGLFVKVAGQAENLARQLGDAGWLVRFLMAKVDGLINTREFSQAIQAATEAAEICRKMGDRGWYAQCLSKRALSRAQSNAYEGAVADFSQAIKIFQELGLAKIAANAGIDAGYYLRSQPATAVNFFNEALAAAEKTGDPGLIASVLGRRAQIRMSDAPAESVQDYLRALPYSERASEEANTPGDFLGMMSRVSQALRQVGKFSEALEIENQRAAKARAKALPRAEADAYFSLQNIYASDLGEPAQALEYVRKWQTLTSEPGWKLSVNDHNKIAIAWAGLGQPARALEHWANALKLAKETPAGEYLQRMVHNNVAELYLKLGDYDAAISELEAGKSLIDITFDAYRKSIELQKAEWSNEMALAHLLSGDLNKALEYSLQAIQLEMKSAPGTALAGYFSYFTPGDALALAGRFEEAVDFQNKRRERARETKSVLGERSALERLGVTYMRAGNIQKARQSFQEAVEIDRKPPGPQTGDLAGSLLELAKLELSAGDSMKAEELLAEARKTANPYDPTLLWQIERASAQAFAKAGKTDLARNHFELALESLEDVRERLRPEEFRLRFGMDRRGVYDEYAWHMAGRAMETGSKADAAKALQIIERRRAQALWDLMATGWTSLQPEAVPEQLQRAREIEARLTAKQNKLRSQFILAPDKRNSKLIETLEADLHQAKDEHARLLASLSQGRYRYASPAGLGQDNLAAVQKKLGRDEALLEYFVNDEATFIFVVTSSDLKLNKIPIGRDKLRQKVYGLLQPLHRLRTGELDLARLSFDLETAHDLCEQLFAPVEANIGRARRILIVPDDVLYYLPFEALVDRLPPQRRPPAGILFAEYGQAGFLLRRYTMSYLTTASHLLSVTETPQPAQSGFMLLAMANPTAGQDAPVMGMEDPVKRRLRSSNSGAAFTPLPGTMTEIDRISRYFPKRAVAMVTGAQATETNYKTLATKYEIVHLATHAFAADDQPLYSTMILAPDSKAQEDGFLQAYEILRYPLQAKLVVLSACETALGPLGRGEGLIGLVSAFQQAGARSVIATQWSIDESAAELMAVFYRAFTTGKTSAAALREAKLEILKRRVRLGGSEVSLAHPFFWAPFVLIGSGDDLLPKT